MRMGICVPFTKLQRSQVFVEAPSFSVLLIRAEHKVIIICVNKASASIKHQLISGQLLQGQHLSPAGVMIGEDYLLELHSKTSLAHTISLTHILTVLLHLGGDVEIRGKIQRDRQPWWGQW